MAVGRDSKAVANWILDWGDTRGVPITPLALQKILYFLHGLWLAQFGSPLIREPFQAWEYGPVIQPLYREFKNNQNNPIKNRSIKIDLFTGKTEIPSTSFSKNEEHFVLTILEKYAKMPTHKLVKLSHKEGGAWHLVWNHVIKTPNMIIENHMIRREFSQNKYHHIN